jgi:hypothetical protein
MTWNKKGFVWLGIGLLLAAAVGWAQEPSPEPQGTAQDAAPPSGGMKRGPNAGQGQPVFGKITAIHDGAIDLARPDGSSVTVKITGNTEYRKDRQAAKLEDFKVGDVVFVRGEQNADHSVTAQMVGGRSGGGMTGGGGRGPGGNVGFGELGKDFVLGEVKSIDAPKITVLRPDHVTQILELNEETSLRKGRESITMADIQPGDHVVVHGGLQNNTFVPKNLVVLSPEQWQRLQEMATMVGGPGAKAQQGETPAGAPKSNPPQR